MNNDLYNALEEALTSLESGIELDSIFSDNPELEHEFGDILQILLESRQDVNKKIPVEILNRSRTHLLSRTMQLQKKPKPRLLRLLFTHRLVIALVLTMVILLSGGGLAVESAHALPGDPLYPVKRAAENVRLSLTITLDDHQAVEDRYQARRINEIQQIFSLGRSEFVQFHGLVNRHDENIWDIGSIEVHQNPETILIGDIQPGITVEVEGLTDPKGWVDASEIHLQSLSFFGYVESISPESWRISGRIVQIVSQTQINPQIHIGDWVVVSARSDDFGNLTAQIIDISNLPTTTPNVPTPTPTVVTTPYTDDEPVEDRLDEQDDDVEAGDSSIEEHEDGKADDSENKDDDESADEKEEEEKEHEHGNKEEEDD